MSESMASPTAAPPPTARIHDLGYKPYQGPRRPLSARWRVIVRSFVAMSWRGWWRIKLWMIGAALGTLTMAILMYVLRKQKFGDAMMAGQTMTFTDMMLPMSYEFLPWAAFVVTLSCIAGAVSKDLRADAFEFYFSRPIRPVDYVAGKLGGAVFVTGIILFAGPFLLSLFRVGLSRDLSDLVRTIPVIPKAALVGAAASLAYAAVPLAISSLTTRTRNAVAAWAAFYLLAGGVFVGIAHGARIPEIAAFYVPLAVSGFAYGIFDINFLFFRPVPPLWACAASLCAYSAVAVAILLLRVRSAQRRGIAGSG